MKKKIAALLTALVLLLTAASSLALTVTPDDTDLDKLPGREFSATLGEYSETNKTFPVTVYEKDRFDEEDVKKLKAGDTLIAGGAILTITDIQTVDGELKAFIEGGEELYFVPEGDEYTAVSAFDDRVYMHVCNQLYLPMAADCVLEDSSDPEAEEARVSKGPEEILKGIGNVLGDMYYTCTTVTVNQDYEITHILRVYDPGQ